MGGVSMGVKSQKVLRKLYANSGAEEGIADDE